MTKVNYDSDMKKDEEKYNLGQGGNSEYFNVKEGSDNVIRILQPAISYASYFNNATKKSSVAYGFDKGDPIRDEEGMYPSSFSIRYAQYVLDKSDGKVKLATLPYTVQNGIRMLQQNPDFAFDEVPMPYDIRITYNKDESPANKYKVAGVPRVEPIEDEVLVALEGKMSELSLEDFVSKMKENQMKKDKEAGTWVTPEAFQAELKEKGLDVTKELREQATKNQETSGSESQVKKEDINPDDIPF